MSEGDFVNMRPQLTEGRGGRRRVHRHLRHDRLAGRERPRQQRPGRPVGRSPTPASTPPPARPIPTRPSPPSRPRRRSPTGSSTTSTATAPSSCRWPSTSSPPSASRRPEPTTEDGERFDHGTPDGYAFFLDLGPLSNANDRFLHGEIAVLERHRRAPELRRLLAEPATSCRTSPTSAPRCWWSAAGSTPRTSTVRWPPTGRSSARTRQTFNVLVMGPWPHGGWSRGDGDTLGGRRLRLRDLRATTRSRSSCPFFRHYLKGEGGRRTWPRPPCSRPAPTAGAASTPGRRRARAEDRSTCRRGRRALLRRRPRPRAPAARPRPARTPSTATSPIPRSRCRTPPS